ncbi:MAG: stage II sporulation protein R [Oscillospiraceae bacterium]|jgi:stage II sporulation protein R|nr:stage II sporulation protein R [Oscillospiraceae bacterium]
MKFKNWELAFIIAILITLLCGSALSREQAELSDKLIRLHVVANSDSADDQALKLRVRDAVLASLAPKLGGVTGAAEAARIIEENFASVRAAALREITRSGYNYDVAVSLREEDFPTRDYDSFSLPAGRYNALRIVIGDGAGKNWWCVVFPPLCTEISVGDENAAAFNELSDDEVKLISEEDGYVVRFKSMEMLAKLKKLFNK